MKHVHLPCPSLDAQTASYALLDIIRRDIHEQNGLISFAHYMERVLYTPTLGYYTGGSHKLGAAGDFITAPEMSPLFGQTIGEFIRTILPQTQPQIMEFGAGSGQLAYDLLTELHAQNYPLARYYIIELSGELRFRQQQLLQHFTEVVWLDHMPESFSGCVLANEVLDAMPVSIIQKNHHGWDELCVTLKDNQLTWATRLLTHVDWLDNIPNERDLPIGYTTEVHPHANAFVSSVFHMIQQGEGGLALFIDYGFSDQEYYLPERHQGTIMCHFRHHAHPDPFFWPGLQDITAHVNFSMVAHAIECAQLDLMLYTSQAAFLLDAGIGNILLRHDPAEQIPYLKHSQKVVQLTSPAEMGELFKVMIASKKVMLPERFYQHDRQHRL